MPTMNQLEETVRKILRNSIAHAVAPERSLLMTEDELSACVHPMEAHTESSMGMLRECLEQARVEGANDVHRALHSQPGVDHEMLDEMVEYAPSGDSDE